jgi:hypothetical protein
MATEADLNNAPFPTPPGVVYRAGDVARGAICPRCPKFIAAHSPVVRLYRPEAPDTRDGRHDRKTGDAYYYDARSINLKPRWFVHERCWEAGR